MVVLVRQFIVILYVKLRHFMGRVISGWDIETDVCPCPSVYSHFVCKVALLYGRWMGHRNRTFVLIRQFIVILYVKLRHFMGSAISGWDIETRCLSSSVSL